jgi:hypothetical protein
MEAIEGTGRALFLILLSDGETIGALWKPRRVNCRCDSRSRKPNQKVTALTQRRNGGGLVYSVVGNTTS